MDFELDNQHIAYSNYSILSALPFQKIPECIVYIIMQFMSGDKNKKFENCPLTVKKLIFPVETEFAKQFGSWIVKLTKVKFEDIIWQKPHQQLHHLFKPAQLFPQKIQMLTQACGVIAAALSASGLL